MKKGVTEITQENRDFPKKKEKGTNKLKMIVVGKDGNNVEAIPLSWFLKKKFYRLFEK